ncbi:p115 like vesicle tethering protein [Kockovaella imperatae]|uniref:p115 like vesicle tethering protein n=1 Tax=Kockovaella imperatae TaxID=4999 RepID=A0A1Y1UC72_9TREE|nr:p115 like vesicle tethering protein [Kockovaella imperatae]ORX35648.1 p115 like vesicle tethering protein [Kockovaella imperatae]
MSEITSMFGSRLTSAYNSLRGELGAPQGAVETIDKLVDRIQTSAAVEDRRTAVLGLKGLSRDWREDVGTRAMPSLIAVLQHDAPYDTDIAKAALETLMQLCEVPEKPGKDDLGLRFADAFLETPGPLHSLLALLSTSPSFYPRFYALQFLAQLFAIRATNAQAYIISAPPPGVEGILGVLDPRAPQSQPSGVGGGAGEMLRNEALLLLPTMLASNQDLQKIVAFSGAFEKLFEIIEQEGGSDGGIVVQDALTVIAGLIRHNVSNQNYFRELSLIASIPPILGFPAQLPLDVPAPDETALQFWPEQKIYNASLVIGIVRMLIGGPGGGNQSAMASTGVTRCLLELALASNATSTIKSQALNTLTPILTSSIPNQNLFASLHLAPLVPVHADLEHPNGGFVRLSPRPAVVALVALVVDGDPSAGGRGLQSRAAGVNMFEAFVNGNDDARIDILTSMTAQPMAAHSDAPQSAGAIILSGLLDLPSSPDAPFDPYRPLFASLLLSHLVRNSEHAKKIAREVDPSVSDSALEDDEDKTGLVQLVVGNLMMAAREQTEAVNRAAREGKPSDEEEWTRVMVGYLVLLCTWLWDSPKTVKEFLSESANLQVLIQPITQTTGIDPLVQGLCAFLLGVCYEFNREPGEITRGTLHPILHSRIGPDQFVSRMARLREDPRFRAVQPESFEQDPTQLDPVEDLDDLELWFDWAFVDFWKNHYYTIQRSIAIDPDAVRGPTTASDDGETAAIIMTLRQKLKAQTDEVVQLQAKLAALANEHRKEKETLVAEVESLSEQVATLSTSLQTADSSRSTHTAELDKLRGELETERQKVSTSEANSADHANTRAELEKAQTRVEELEKSHAEDKSSWEERHAETEAGSSSLKKENDQLKSHSDALSKQLSDLETQLAEEKTKREDGEKEHEDLLVLLEELSQKRRKDKERMKENGMEVSEGEDEDEEEDDDNNNDGEE